MTQLKSWFSENSTLISFLAVQTMALVAGAASLFAYAINLENRVYTMEHRGAEYTVSRMQQIEQRITVNEQRVDQNTRSIERIVDVATRALSTPPGTFTPAPAPRP